MTAREELAVALYCEWCGAGPQMPCREWDSPVEHMHAQTFPHSRGRLAAADALLASPSLARVIREAKAVDLWESITADNESSERNWPEILRAAGVKLAHPDDGWVKRDRNTFSLSWYPAFNDNPQVGDLIAFGSPPQTDHYRPRDGKPESARDGYRICRVTKVDDRSGVLVPGRIVTYHYEDTGARMPARARRKWRKR